MKNKMALDEKFILAILNRSVGFIRRTVELVPPTKFDTPDLRNRFKGRVKKLIEDLETSIGMLEE